MCHRDTKCANVKNKQQQKRPIDLLNEVGFTTNLQFEKIKIAISEKHDK